LSRLLRVSRAAARSWVSAAAYRRRRYFFRAGALRFRAGALRRAGRVFAAVRFFFPAAFPFAAGRRADFFPAPLFAPPALPASASLRWAALAGARAVFFFFFPAGSLSVPSAASRRRVISSTSPSAWMERSSPRPR